VKKLIKHLNGKIQVKSTAGQTCFIVEILLWFSKGSGVIRKSMV
jgi:hypothetical protein